jgi:hypothetical protein
MMCTGSDCDVIAIHGNRDLLAVRLRYDGTLAIDNLKEQVGGRKWIGWKSIAWPVWEQPGQACRRTHHLRASIEGIVDLGPQAVPCGNICDYRDYNHRGANRERRQ